MSARYFLLLDEKHTKNGIFKREIQYYQEAACKHFVLVLNDIIPSDMTHVI